jgi:hypothetical protein
MSPKLGKSIAIVVAVLMVIGVAVTLAVVSPLVAHQMEPYRQNPPADTTIHVPTESRSY